MKPTEASQIALTIASGPLPGAVRWETAAELEGGKVIRDPNDPGLAN